VQSLGHKYTKSLPKLQTTCHLLLFPLYEVYKATPNGTEAILISKKNYLFTTV